MIFKRQLLPMLIMGKQTCQKNGELQTLTKLSMRHQVCPSETCCAIIWHVTSDATPHHDISFDMAWYVTSHVMPCHILAWHVMSCHFMSTHHAMLARDNCLNCPLKGWQFITNYIALSVNMIPVMPPFLFWQWEQYYLGVKHLHATKEGAVWHFTLEL